MNTVTTIVIGVHIDTREAAIAACIVPGMRTALILEGLPHGNDLFALLSERCDLHIARIAPGCLCCTGNLTLRVTLNRVLRQRPERLYISVTSNTHVTELHGFLTTAPYDTLLTMTEPLDSDGTTPAFAPPMQA